MNLIITGIFILIGIALIVMVIKQEIAYKKEKEFNDSLKREYNPLLKNDYDIFEDEY
ncbi:MAG: hypothetical protein ABIQ27_06705 [Flavobacterium sp.]|uniref:hypothetical protein n=1 Tax=Flavobacterium sp. TaxID=239 RepID=UPI003264304C